MMCGQKEAPARCLAWNGLGARGHTYEGSDPGLCKSSEYTVQSKEDKMLNCRKANNNKREEEAESKAISVYNHT